MWECGRVAVRLSRVHAPPPHHPTFAAGPRSTGAVAQPTRFIHRPRLRYNVRAPADDDSACPSPPRASHGRSRRSVVLSPSPHSRVWIPKSFSIFESREFFLFARFFEYIYFNFLEFDFTGSQPVILSSACPRFPLVSSCARNRPSSLSRRVRNKRRVFFFELSKKLNKFHKFGGFRFFFFFCAYTDTGSVHFITFVRRRIYSIRVITDTPASLVLSSIIHDFRWPTALHQRWVTTRGFCELDEHVIGTNKMK